MFYLFFIKYLIESILVVVIIEIVN